jgi:hypothetical protein
MTMPISYAELKARLDVDEPDYAALAEMAAGAIQHLRKLAASPDESQASKAVSLAGIMGDAESIVDAASKSRKVLVRVAAAHASSLMPDSPQATRVVSRLLDDKDVGVVKLAARAATHLSDPKVAAKARRAAVRMVKAVRASAKASRQDRSAGMAAKRGKKTGAGATMAKTVRKGSKASAGKMPSGAMVKAPTGAKAGDMPTGEMK